jgi:hypothetical protein
LTAAIVAASRFLGRVSSRYPVYSKSRCAPAERQIQLAAGPRKVPSSNLFTRQQLERWIWRTRFEPALRTLEMRRARRQEAALADGARGATPSKRVRGRAGDSITAAAKTAGAAIAHRSGVLLPQKDTRSCWRDGKGQNGSWPLNPGNSRMNWPFHEDIRMADTDNEFR